MAARVLNALDRLLVIADEVIEWRLLRRAAPIRPPRWPSWSWRSWRSS